MHENETPTPGALSIPVLLAAAAVAQLFLVGPLWTHTSTGGAILGRYSARYALALGGWIVITLGWGAAFLARRRVAAWLAAVSPRGRWLAAGLSVMIGAAAWFVPVEGELRIFASLNGIVCALVLIRSLPDAPVRWRRWHWGLIALAALILVPMCLGVLAHMRFSPDEAVWADISTAPFVADGLYARMYLREPYPVTPGQGWLTAGYGWLLRHVWFDIRLGRLWNFIGYVLAFVGIGLVTRRLYGMPAAAISASLAAVSRFFTTLLDYRPDHQLPLVTILTVYAAVEARYARSRRARAFWHGACGLAATLGMQVHAAAVVIVVGVSLYYVAEWAYAAYRQRRIVSLEPLVWFGLGAGIGTGVYYVFNVEPVGGFKAYLDELNRTRGGRLNWFPFLLRYYFIERIAAWGALVYLVWRHSPADRLFLGLFACIVLVDVPLDRPAYFTLFSALFAVPVGALLVDGLSTAGIPRGQNRHTALAGAAIFVVLAASIARGLIFPAVPDLLKAGHFSPYVYERLGPYLAPYISDDDVIVSTESLIWTFPDHPALYSVAGEEPARQRWGVSGLEVWERVQPTVVVKVSREVIISPDLQAYMDLHAFQTCDTIRLMGYRVDVYRAACP